MTTGEKLAKLRREKRYTQEQLAEQLGVSRQAISRWESDMAFPETEKLIRLSDLYGCTVDYMLKENVPISGEKPAAFTLPFSLRDFYVEYKSPKTFRGIPLVHVNWGLGRTAKGIVAIGVRAKGCLALGIFSMGILSFGVFSFGLLALGAFCLVLLACGAVAAGGLACGAIAVGLFSLGAVSVGLFANGALAVGRYAAVGDRAYAMVAVGKTRAVGNIFQYAGAAVPWEQASRAMDRCVPWWLSWLKDLMALCMRLMV